MSLEVLKEFDSLNIQNNKKSLIYLDSAATTLTPKVVVDRISAFNSFETANVHRGAHFLSDKATQSFEEARKTVADFVGAISEEIIFTSGTTDSLNLLAQSLCADLSSGDEVILTDLEHHSNIVPWFMESAKSKFKIKYIPIAKDGGLDFEVFKGLLSDKTKILSLTYCSNALGSIVDIAKFTAEAKKHGVTVVVDAAQAVTALDLNVSKLGCDYLVASAHKAFGPFGLGIIFGKKNLLNAATPFKGGGSMIDKVSHNEVTYLESPHRHEAGTPNISGAIGFAEALKFINNFGRDNIFKHEQQLLKYTYDKLIKIPGLEVYGDVKNKLNLLTFNIKDIHPADMAQLLSEQAIAIRAGHHCAQLVMGHYNLKGTLRVSLSVYNTEQDIDKLIIAINKSLEVLQ